MHLERILTYMKKTIIKNKYPLTILNLVSIAFYIYIYNNLSIGIDENIMFSLPDARGYLSVADWMLTGEGGINTLHRPFLYPLFLLFTKSVFGISGVWFFQFIFWLLTINFTYLSLKKLTKSTITAFAGAIVVLVNISLIVFTLHALTEVVVTFLLSVLVCFIAFHYKKLFTLYFFHWVLLLFSVLTAIKPAFYIPLLAILFVGVFVYYKHYLRSPKKILLAFLVLAPLFVQLGVMKVKNDMFTVSTIGNDTFTNYYIAKTLVGKKGATIKEVRIALENLETSGKFALVKKHPELFYSNFLSNLDENLTGKPIFLSYPEGVEHPTFFNFMKKMNGNYYRLHVSIYLVLIVSGLLLFHEKGYTLLLSVVFLTLLLVYYILISGISFWQGDRLVLPAIAIWTVLYFYLFHRLYFFYWKLATPFFKTRLGKIKNGL